MIRQLLAPLALAACLVASATAMAQEATPSWLPTLITETPEKGFDLAISMARKAVKTTQPDVEMLHHLRPVYAHDPSALIDVSGVVAAYFATVAAANDYWRE